MLTICETPAKPCITPIPAAAQYDVFRWLHHVDGYVFLKYYVCARVDEYMYSFFISMRMNM